MLIWHIMHKKWYWKSINRCYHNNRNYVYVRKSYQIFLSLQKKFCNVCLLQYSDCVGVQLFTFVLLNTSAVKLRSLLALPLYIFQTVFKPFQFCYINSDFQNTNLIFFDPVIINQCNLPFQTWIVIHPEVSNI